MSNKPNLALEMPLTGSRLIEASAGTGKTFTISALYVRLVLGHGGEARGFGRALLPPEILVVTFTEAATQELRDRIRTRLAQSARHFRGELADPDELLVALRNEYPPADWPRCALRLDTAAQWMDEAAVSTIHSWCQRMLREHAFDSGSLFTQTLETDQSDLLAEVVNDFWREHFYPLHGAALAWVHKHWGSPDALRQRARPLLGLGLGVAHADIRALIETALAERGQRLAALKEPWLLWAEELRTLLDGACASKAVDGRRLQARWYNGWCDALKAWASDPEAVQLDIGTGFARLTPDGLAEIWKQGMPFRHDGLQAIAELPAALAALADPDEALLRHAVQWIEQRFDREKRQRAQIGFDDMLTRLDAALAGDSGARLAEVIRRQFPMALIDEFQDTDPLQYRIFQRIYGIGEARDDCAILLIGDPKQAIYAFRGADIFTYLKARAATEDRHHTLDTNFRSSTTLVEAVNGVFRFAEQQPLGAFLFKSETDNPLPFHRVDARGRPETLEIGGAAQSPMTLWHLAEPQPISGERYRRELAAASATEITRLLNLGLAGQAGFRRADGTLQPLCPADIAVLVRDGREARAIRQQLARRGVRSVYLSDKSSVFDSQEAADALAWLRACAEPDDERLLRAALATVTLGRSLSELHALTEDELAWEARVMQFRGYRQQWRRQGVLPMLRHLMQDFALPQRLMAGDDGERALTNLLHLAELLQQAAGELDGEQALIRHLAEHLDGQGQGAEEQILRLESDDALVRVVTIHKSKGLEYPLVFLPFICAHRPVEGDPPLRYHDGQGELQVDLRPDAAAVDRADRERLGEDLRLLYVALTRARHACWLGLAELKRRQGKDSCLHRSAIGYVLAGGKPFELAPKLGELQAAASGIRLVAPPLPDAQRFQPPSADRAALQARLPQRRAQEHWWIASYSALALAGEDTVEQVEAPDSPAAQKIHDDDAESRAFAGTAEGAELHRFPRGPQPGTFLHGLLEWAGLEGFAEALSNDAARREMLARRCQLRGWQQWIEPLDAWLRDYLQVPLTAGEQPLRLADLEHYQVEMEFWFSSHQVDVRRLDALVRAHTLDGAPRPALAPSRLNGLFKGFIDLVFEFEGRYYVVDYKSNWLGGDALAYHAEAMRQTVLEKRYDLQYVLYLLALHRQLKARLPDYDYERHMGGALYLFLRGGAQGVHAERPPRALIEALDRLFAGHSEVCP
jgi:exodeoxyribonuclease V beta subunit